MRTREHWLADLSVNYVERLILLQGHTVERPKNDYGYDLKMQTFDYGDDAERMRGAAENGEVYFQLKATRGLRLLNDGETIAFPIERRHLRTWQTETMPVILVIYDALEEKAYWLYAQNYLKGVVLLPGDGTLTLRLPKQNALNEAAIETFRRYKAKVEKDTKKENLHG